VAQITYTVPLLPFERTEAIMSGVIGHMREWAAQHNASLMSIVRNGPNVEYTFSNPVPAVELAAIRISQWD
jgi:hypothetical protein